MAFGPQAVLKAPRRAASNLPGSRRSRQKRPPEPLAAPRAPPLENVERLPKCAAVAVSLPRGEYVTRGAQPFWGAWLLGTSQNTISDLESIDDKQVRKLIKEKKEGRATLNEELC